MAKYFGTDGFRGEANISLTADHAYKIGRFLGWHFKEKHEKEGGRFPPRIVIGKDTRRSSYMLEYCLAGGLNASGCDCYLLHVTTTPCVAYITKTDEFDCGIMISASHNPFYDNGIKLINSKGEKMGDELIEKLEAYLDGETCKVPFALRDKIAKTVDYVSGRNRYMGYLISLGIHSFKGMRIGLDCANGSAWNIARSVFEALGASVYMIGAEPDGININYMTGSTYIDELRDFVRAKRLDAGFAYDGDADRCLAVDENGKLVDGDLILYVCGKYLKEQGRLNGDTIVTTIMSNLGLYKACDKAGLKYEKTAVGDKYVSENMTANNYSLGGEQSGHIIFSKYATTGDGILTSLLIMEVMLEKKQSLAKLTEEVTIYPQLLKNVRVADKKTARENPAVVAAIAQVTEELGDNGRILVRESGTEPVIRVMVEAETNELCAQYVKQVIDVICSEGLIILE